MKTLLLALMALIALSSLGCGHAAHIQVAAPGYVTYSADTTQADNAAQLAEELAADAYEADQE